MFHILVQPPYEKSHTGSIQQNFIYTCSKKYNLQKDTEEELHSTNKNASVI